MNLWWTFMKFSCHKLMPKLILDTLYMSIALTHQATATYVIIFTHSVRPSEKQKRAATDTMREKWPPIGCGLLGHLKLARLVNTYHFKLYFSHNQNSFLVGSNFFLNSIAVKYQEISFPALFLGWILDTFFESV